MIWIVYILHCGDGSFYTGITNDMDRRLRAHQNGTGAKYTRGRGPFTLAHQESYATKGEAMARECAIKAMTRMDKLALTKRTP